MQTIADPADALAVLHDPGFVVPPVPAAAAVLSGSRSDGPSAPVAAGVLCASRSDEPSVPESVHGVAWLRSCVGRFSHGDAYTRRRAISEALLSTVDPAALREAAASSPHAHPVQLLATALGLGSSPGTTLAAVRTVAAAYQPGTGDETAADEAVRTLLDLCGGPADETTAARIGLLVQACDATAALIGRARTAGLAAALRDTPPVPATKRMATRPAALTTTRVEAGETVRVSLHGIPFGAGPRSCPGRAHALALAEGALTAPPSPGEHPPPAAAHRPADGTAVAHRSETAAVGRRSVDGAAVAGDGVCGDGVCGD
ncbi:hypothetical protein [Dactylosporangium sp. NPDC005555]|uniref:hypothetical protein n=1 Tax=Dactylosporangium sp. NPDC005555 TaxID=3154889 RepID=UPI0033BF878F